MEISSQTMSRSDVGSNRRLEGLQGFVKQNFFLRFVPFHLGCKCVPRNVSDDPKNGLTGEFYVKKGK